MKETKDLSYLIITFNRADILKNTLSRLQDVLKENQEVIVIDNNSSDETSNIVNEFSFVKYKKLKRNIGINAWNVAAKIAQGKYFFFLDDDSYPSTDVPEKAIKFMIENSNVGVLACKIVNKSFGFVETEGFTPEPKMFIGCGAVIRREVFFKAGGFNRFQFVYYHELDFAARCYDLGYKIRYNDKLTVYHEQFIERGLSKTPFESHFRYYHHFISYMVFLLQRFSLNYTLMYVPKYLINRLILAIKYRYIKEFILASWKIIKDFRKIWRKRKVISEKAQLKMDNGNIAIIDKI